MSLRYVALVVLLLLAGCGSQPPQPTAGPRLYLAGDGELWVVDTATGRVRHEVRSQLRQGDTPHKILARGHQLIIGDAFGDSAFFLPSVHRDRVWVVDLRASTSRARSVREVTVDGVTTVAARKPPGGRWPLAAVDGGLLLDAGDGTVEVWDPRTGRVVRRLTVDTSSLGPTTGRLISSCTDPECHALRLTDTHSGAARVVPAPAGTTFEPWNAAFTPAGDLLGVTVTGDRTGPRRLALVDVADGRTAIVPGSAVPAGYTLVAWSATGRYVFLTGGERFAKRVLVGYRIGTRRALAIHAAVGAFYDVAAI